MIAPRTSIAERPHRVRLQNPGAQVFDGSGGYTTTWADLSPAWLFARIAPATATDLERAFAGTSISSASHLVSLPYHPQITTKTRLTYTERGLAHTLTVAGVASPEERGQESTLLCNEVVA